MKRLMILSGMLLLMLLMSACGPGSQASSEESPLQIIEESPPATLTPVEWTKIDSDLLAVIEWEEEHPGEGREVAPDDFIFDSNGWIECGVRLDPNIVVITSTATTDLPVDEQPAGQLIVRYGGRPNSAIKVSNTVYFFISLDKIRDLAREEAVIEIFPNWSRPWTPK